MSTPLYQILPPGNNRISLLVPQIFICACKSNNTWTVVHAVLSTLRTIGIENAFMPFSLFGVPFCGTLGYFAPSPLQLEYALSFKNKRLLFKWRGSEGLVKIRWKNYRCTPWNWILIYQKCWQSGQNGHFGGFPAKTKFSPYTRTHKIH